MTCSAQPGRGDIVYMPRNIPHRFQNGDAKPGRMLIVFSPGGFERGFFEVGRLVRGDDDVLPRLRRTSSSEYGPSRSAMEFAGSDADRA